MIKKNIDAYFDPYNDEQLKCLCKLLDYEEFGESPFSLHYRTIPSPAEEKLRNYYSGWADPITFESRNKPGEANRNGLKVMDKGDDKVNYAHVAMIFPNMEGKIPHMIKVRHFNESAPKEGETGPEGVIDAPERKEYWSEKYANMILILTHLKEPSDSVRSRYQRIWTVYTEHMKKLVTSCRKCGTRDQKWDMRCSKDYKTMVCTNKECKAEMDHPKWVYVGKNWENVDFIDEYTRAFRMKDDKMKIGAGA